MGSTKQTRSGPLLPSVVIDYLGMAIVLGVLILVFRRLATNFFTFDTFKTNANLIPAPIIIAVGMTFVLIIAGIDLSVGSVVALGGSVLGVCIMTFHWPLWLSIIACLGVGLACGLLNGLVVIKWMLPSFIVTLGMMEIARGGAYLATNSQTIYIGATIERISSTTVFGLSLPFLLAVLIVIAGQLTLSKSSFGRRMVAIGANEEAARLSGVNTKRVKVAVFAISGFLAALAAVINTSRMSSADPNAGLGYELQAIAAVVIGGTSLMGGRGSVISSFFGVLIIATLSAGLFQIGVQEPTKRLITGCVIVSAVVLDHYRHRLSARS